MAEYRPGACNIGGGERRKRYAGGAVGFVAAAVTVKAVEALALPSWTVVAVAVPVFVGFLGVYQARLGFCVGFAAAGIYDVSDDGDDRRKVADDAARRADSQRSRRIYAYTAVSTLVATALVYLVFIR
jgi:hypothetical protein